MIFDVFRYRFNCDFYNPNVPQTIKVSFPEHIPFCHRKHDLNFYELESNAEYVEFAFFNKMSEFAKLQLALKFNKIVRDKLSFYSKYYQNTFVSAYNRNLHNLMIYSPRIEHSIFLWIRMEYLMTCFGTKFFFTVEKMNYKLGDVPIIKDEGKMENHVLTLKIKDLFENKKSD